MSTQCSIEGSIVLYDGPCALCNRSMLWMMRRNRKAIFKFVSLQSIEGQALLAQHHLPLSFNESIILIEKNSCYFKSSAVLKILKSIDGFWKIAYLLRVLPKGLRDWIYDEIASRRYQWFSNQDTCSLPDDKLKP